MTQIWLDTAELINCDLKNEVKITHKIKQLFTLSQWCSYLIWTYPSFNSGDTLHINWFVKILQFLEYCDLENKVKVTKIYSVLVHVLMIYPYKFKENLPTGSRDIVHTRNCYGDDANAKVNTNINGIPIWKQ